MYEGKKGELIPWSLSTQIKFCLREKLLLNTAMRSAWEEERIIFHLDNGNFISLDIGNLGGMIVLSILEVFFGGAWVVGVSISLSGWFCEVGGCVKKGGLFPKGVWRASNETSVGGTVDKHSPPVSMTRVLSWLGGLGNHSLWLSMLNKLPLPFTVN